MKIRKQDEELLLYSQGQLAFLTSQRQRKKAVIWSRIILSIGFLVLWQMASDFEWIDDFTSVHQGLLEYCSYRICRICHCCGISV